MQTIEQQSLLITEEKIIAPIETVLDEVTPKPPSSFSLPDKSSQAFKQCLDELFPEQQYEDKNIQKAKEILGEIAYEFTQTQLKDTVAEVQFLAESWLDDFEREIFGGLTLQELLHEKGSL